MRNNEAFLNKLKKLGFSVSFNGLNCIITLPNAMNKKLVFSNDCEISVQEIKRIFECKD